MNDYEITEYFMKRFRTVVKDGMEKFGYDCTGIEGYATDALEKVFGDLYIDTYR